jgi:hypothetical protein
MVAGETLSGRFMTLETVPTDTPARCATSRTLTAAIAVPFVVLAIEPRCSIESLQTA